MYKRTSLLFLLAGAICTCPAPLLAQQPPAELGAAGTLSCTTGAEPPASSSAEIVLSCSFRGTSGLQGSYQGYVARLGPDDFPSGKRVLIWSVLAPPGEIMLTDLAGQYTGTTGGESAKRLTGGRDDTVMLEPTTETSQIGGVPQPTILNLRLQLNRS